MSTPTPPQDADLQISAISQFLTSPLFLTPISTFVDKNCCMFEDSNEYSPGHHAVFLEFRSLVESLLEGTLSQLHITSEELVASLSLPEFRSTPRVVGVVDTLRGMDDFVLFHDNMVARNGQIEMSEQQADGQAGAAPEAKGTGASAEPPPSPRVPRSNSPVDQSSWEFQVAQAANLLANATSPDPLKNLMLPWASAVKSVRREMESRTLSTDRKQRILTELAGHKLRVDFIVAQREANDRREKLNNDLFKNEEQAEMLNFLLNELHRLRTEVASARGRAINYRDGEVGSEALNLVYFYLKDMVNDGRIPAEEVDQVIPFTRLHVKKEDDEMVVLVLR
ncbi:hypothetical protein TrRE_jg9532, partial [Triparma retinervis]